MSIKPYASIFVLILLAITGCASRTTSGIPSRVVSSNFSQLSLGMTPEEVVGLVGQPANRRRTINPEGPTELWTYTQFSFTKKSDAFIAGLAAANAGRSLPPSDPVLHLFFRNGRVAEFQTIQNPR